MGFAGRFGKYLPEGATEKDKVGGTLAKLKGVNELLADTLEATEKLDIVVALRAASPWAEAVGSALGDALPPVRFVLKLFDELTRIDDPNELGYLAATLAYQRAVEQAWSAMPVATREKMRGADARVRKRALAELRSAAPAESYDFSRFTFEGRWAALSSPMRTGFSRCRRAVWVSMRQISSSFSGRCGIGSCRTSRAF